MKKIGMIGGLSWLSTAEYYRLLNELTQAALGGVHSAHLILESVDRQEYADHVYGRKDEAAACEMIRSAARAVEKGGADFIVISCNDVHRFVDAIQPAVSIPFLHIAAATAEIIREAGLRTVALMGVRKTMEEKFYPDVLAGYGIDTMIPKDTERDFIDSSIMNEMVKGVFSPATKARFAELITNLVRRGAEGVVLGCTEIPLLIGPGDVDVPTFSTTEIHCRAAVRLALAD